MIHDLDFMCFVCDYEDAYDEKLSKEKSLRLYAEYDAEWEYAKKENRQFMRFAKDSASNPIINMSDGKHEFET